MRTDFNLATMIARVDSERLEDTPVRVAQMAELVLSGSGRILKGRNCEIGAIASAAFIADQERRAVA